MNDGHASGRAAWLRRMGLVLLVVVLAEGLSYTFVWTYAAGTLGVRGALAQHVAVSVVISCLLTWLVLKLPFGAGEVRDWKSRLWVVGAIGGAVVVLCFLRDVLIWDLCTWSGVLWNGLVVAPLCVALFMLSGTMVARLSRGGYGAKLTAVIAGVAAGHGLLEDVGSIWVTVLVTLIMGGLLVLKRKWPNEVTAEASAGGLVLGYMIVQLGQVAFGPFPFGWDAAIMLVLWLACWAMGMVATHRKMSGVSVTDHGIVPAPAQADAPATRVSAWRLLPVGWTVILFLTFCWTEPQMMAKPVRPFVFSLPEPRPMGGFGISLSEAAAHYSAEWDRYNAVQFENSMKTGEYAELAGIAGEWNAFVGKEVRTRQAVKWVGWILMIFLTWLWGRRVEGASAAGGSVTVSGAAIDLLGAGSASAINGHGTPEPEAVALPPAK